MQMNLQYDILRTTTQPCSSPSASGQTADSPSLHMCPWTLSHIFYLHYFFILLVPCHLMSMYHVSQYKYRIMRPKSAASGRPIALIEISIMTKSSLPPFKRHLIHSDPLKPAALRTFHHPNIHSISNIPLEFRDSGRNQGNEKC